MDETTLGRTLRATGYRKLSARPRHHAQDPQAAEAFKRNIPDAVAAIRAALADGTAIEIWWQDEARVGHKKQDHAPLGQARNAARRAP